MNDTLIGYIRDEDHNPHGCMVGKLVGDKVMIGISVCRAEVDRFDKQRARRIAEGRIAAGRNSALRNPTLVNALEQSMAWFRDKCERYFKTENIEVVGS